MLPRKSKSLHMGIRGAQLFTKGLPLTFFLHSVEIFHESQKSPWMWSNVNGTIMLFGGCVVSCVCVVDKEACERKLLYLGFCFEVHEKVTYQKLNMKIIPTESGVSEIFLLLS